MILIPVEVGIKIHMKMRNCLPLYKRFFKNTGGKISGNSFGATEN
jgi:hypothetical protein